MDAIPFCIPYRAPREIDYVADALAQGNRSVDGSYSAHARVLLAQLTGGGSVFLTSSGTSALELALLVAGIGPGDEVILPSFTFTSVANAIVLRGATPVFVDIEPGTLNIAPASVAAAIGPRTRAIIAVHYAGVVADMEALAALASEHGLLLVEDAAHAIGAMRAGRRAGSFGDFAAFSFHYTKNISCGEGGCLVVNRPDLVPATEIAFEKGTNRAAFFRGFVDKYSWVERGGSFTMSEASAALLLAQLEAIETITASRRDLWDRYKSALERLAIPGVELPDPPQDATPNGHLFHLLMPDEGTQHEFITFMRARAITTPFHYVPLHSAPAGRLYGRTQGATAVTDRAWNRLVRLPLYPDLGANIERVIAAIAVWADSRA